MPDPGKMPFPRQPLDEPHDDRSRLRGDMKKRCKETEKTHPKR